MLVGVPEFAVSEVEYWHIVDRTHEVAGKGEARTNLDAQWTTYCPVSSAELKGWRQHAGLGALCTFCRIPDCFRGP